MKKLIESLLKSTAILLFAVLAFAPAAGAATTINVNFGAVTNDAMDGKSFIYTTGTNGPFQQAPAYYTGTTWNDAIGAAPFTVAGLKDSDGNTTAVGFTTVPSNTGFNLLGALTWNDHPDVKMLNGGIYRAYNSGSGNAVNNRFTVTGLNPAKTYNIYVASSREINVKCSWSLGTASAATDPAQFLTNTTPVRVAQTWGAPADNWVVFYAVAPDAEGKIFVWGQGLASGDNGAYSGITLNGFQVVDATGWVNSDKSIYNFGLPVPGTSSVISSNATGTNITWTVLHSWNLASLAPEFTVADFASASPLSGTTHDFSSPVDYTVTAQDGSTKIYHVTAVKAPPSPANDILSFTVPGLGDALLNQAARTITLYVPPGTDVTALSPTLTASPFATVSPLSGTMHNFSSPVQYTVTAENGSPKIYTATVAVLPVPPVATGLVCWYAADSGVSVDASGTIGAWTDISGLLHDATVAAGTPVFAPNQLNSKPAVQLRNGNSWLNCAGAFFAKEQYVVVRSPRTDETWGGYGAFLGRSSGRGSTYVLAPDRPTFWNDQSPSDVAKNGTSVTRNQDPNGNYTYNVAPISNYMILKIVVNDNNATDGAYRIGDVDGNHGCPLDIAEIIAFISTLSPEDEATVGSYLADKYAITTAYPLLRAPAAPTGLTASPMRHSVLLNWTASWSATNYNVYRGTATGVYDPTPIGTTGGATTYTDTHDPADDGKPFYYVVRGVNSVGEGAPSAEASAAPSSAKANQTITFGPLASKTYGNAPFALTATASSLLPVSYASSDPLVASVSGSNVTILKAGTTTITASQAGDADFNAATNVNQLLTVVKANQTVAFTLPLKLVKGTNAVPFADTATGGASGNPVTYFSANTAVATVNSSGLVTIVGVGTTEIRANQAGSADYYNAAPQVAQTLIVIAPPLPVVNGLACWYDAAQGVTEVAGVVQSWADSSTLGHQATRSRGAPVLAPNEVNGRPAVQIRGTQTWLDCAGGMFTKEQYLVVRSPNATWNGSGSFLGRASTDFLSVRASSYNLAANTDGFWQDHFPTAVSKNGTPLAQNNQNGSAFHLDPITDYMILKITVDDTASAANLAQYPFYQIGQNETIGSCDMDIAEIIGYDTVLSAVDEARVGTYLADKYAITTAYPPAHAAILSFGLPGLPATIDQLAMSIAWTVPSSMGLTALKPVYELNSGTCDKDNGGPTAYDFSTPVTYTVTDPGIATNVYTVTVTPGPDPILVGASGSGTLTFDTVPTVQEWSTLNVGGANGDITTAAGLDSMVQANLAANIVTALGSSGTWAPSANNIARRNTGANNGGNPLLQMRPSSTKAVVLMATLYNESGGGINGLAISYDMGTPTTPVNAEEVPGLRAYYSLTGLANSWTVIPALCTATAGTLTANVTLSSPWANGTMMYVLWAEDNNAATDNAYTIDNVSFAPSVPAPTITGITVGPVSGHFTISGVATGSLVTEMATRLNPSDWTPIQTNAVSGPYSIDVPQGTGPAGFYRTRFE